MPKLCPNCQQQLNPIERWAVHLDVCSRCQGVWLDQGELEQVIGFVRASMASGAPGMVNAPLPNQLHHRDHDDHDDDDQRIEYDSNGKPRRKRRFEIGDIFDIFG